MRLGGRTSAVISVAAIAFGFAWGRPGATAQQDNAATKTFQVYTRLKVLDVTATDASGRPVQGLAQSNFTILEDGKPQPIRNFEEVRSQDVEPPRQMPPDVYTNLQPPPPSSAVNILLLDFTNEAPVDSTNLKQVSRSTYLQNQVKQAAIEAIDRMPPGTRIAVLVMTYHLTVVQSFTSNVPLLKAAVHAVPYDLEGHGNDECVQEDMRNRTVLEVFNQVAADVAGMKGRKNLIWFSMGIWTIVDSLHSGHAKCLPDYSKALGQAYDQLTAAQVSIYPLYAGGLGLGSQQLSLEMVADATGGLAYTNTNDLATGVGKAIEDGANYYSVSYVPPSEKLDGAYHKIEVKVDRTDAHLVFRKGYFADDVAMITMPPGLTLSQTPPAVYQGNMKASMSRGMTTSQDLLFEVGIKPSDEPPKPSDPAVMGTLDPKLQGKHLHRYGFTYVVPAEQISFAAGPGGSHKGVLEFDIAAYDYDDKLLTGISQTLKLPLSDSAYRQLIANHGPVRFFQQIDLPPGPMFIRVGVLDATADKAGTLELPLTAGKK